MTRSEEIEIRSLYRIDELEEVRKLESKIWGESDSIPTHQTITAVKNGGLVLGAFYRDQLVGFQYSFPGFNGKSVYLCSHTLGTDSNFRNQGIGEKLKNKQREEAEKLGYSLITWTYDPLESINGYLNIAKLGGVCSTYITNCYGEMEDILNSGIPSDRFLVEWHIGDVNPLEKVGKLDDAMEQSLIQWAMNEEGLPFPNAVRSLPANSDVAYVAIPKDFRTIRNTNLAVGTDWRLKTRDAFSQAFQQGWQVNGFLKNSNSEIPVHFYVLTKSQDSFY